MEMEKLKSKSRSSIYTLYKKYSGKTSYKNIKYPKGNKKFWLDAIAINNIEKKVKKEKKEKKEKKVKKEKKEKKEKKIKKSRSEIYKSYKKISGKTSYKNIKFPKGNKNFWLDAVNNIEKKKIIIDKTPKIDKYYEVDRFGTFNKIRYHLKNVTNLKQFHNLILKAVKTADGPCYVALFFRLNNTNKIRAITINPTFIDDYDDFIERLEEIQGGEVEGSDPINLNIYSLILDYFDISIIRGLTGFGENNFCLFKNDNVYGGNLGTCGYKSIINCLNYLNKIKSIDETKKKKLIETITKQGYSYFQKLVNIKNFINENKLNIGLAENTISLKTSWNKIIEREKIKVCENNKKKTRHKLYKLYNDDVSVQNFDEDYSCYIIILNHHFTSFCGNKLKLNDNIYIDSKQNLIIMELSNLYYKKNWRIMKKMDIISRNILKKKNEKIKLIKNSGFSILYIFFDYETVINWKIENIMQPYSISFLPIYEQNFEKFSSFNQEKKKNFFNKKCYNYVGFDCGKYLVDFFKNNINSSKMIFIGFNNSNFDNYLLVKDFSKYSNIKLDNFFFNKTKLMDVSIDYRHSFFDLHNHLVGSLKYNCESFKLDEFKKKTFDHRKMQRLFDSGQLLKFLKKNINDIREYNNYDVISLSILYYKYRNAVIENGGEKYKNLYKYRTMGSLVKDKFNDHISKYKFYLETYNGLYSQEKELNYRIYKDILKYRSGGRCDLFNGPQIIKKRVVSIDVCSEYPYICCVAPVYFPCGEKQFYLKNGFKYNDERIGFFYCDIDQRNLRKKNLPNIIPEKINGCNDWDSKNILKHYLISTIKIKKLIDLNCKVTVYEGFYFLKKIKNIKLFGFLFNSLKIKNQQDKYKLTKDKRYNPSLRNTTKLELNSISGKMSEGVHSRAIKEINISELIKIKNNPKTKQIREIFTQHGRAFCDFEQKEEKLMFKSNPIHIGTLIYDYAQLYLYETVIEPIGKKDCIYADTDSVKIEYEKFLNWKKTKGCELVPHWPELEKIDPRYKTHKLYEEKSKVFGSFEDELDKNNNYNVFISKKNYLSTSTEKEKHKKFKEEIRFKGVSKKNIIIVEDHALKYDWLQINFFKKSTLKYCIIKNDFFSVKKIKGNYKLNKIKPVNTDNLEKKYLIYNFKNAYNYYSKFNNLTIENNAKKFFDEIYNNGYAYVLCESFKKDLRLKKENNKNFGTIQINYIIKKVSKQKKYNYKIKEENIILSPLTSPCKYCNVKFNIKHLKRHNKSDSHLINVKLFKKYTEVYRSILKHKIINKKIKKNI